MHGLNDGATARKTHDLFDRQADNPCSLGRIIGPRADKSGLLGQHHMTPIILISRIRGKADEMLPIVSLKTGFLGEFTTTGAHGVSILWLNTPGRKFERAYAKSVPILFYEDDVIRVVQGNDLDPIAKFKHIERRNHYSVSSAACVGAYTDPFVP